MTNIITTLDINKNQDQKLRFKELRRKLHGFYKRGDDVSLVQSKIYKEVEEIVFDSDFKYVQVLHYLIRFGIPLEDKLLQALLSRTYSNTLFQNKAEEDAFRICKELFPEAIPNIHLGGLGGIEMDILLPFRRVNIEIDSKSSPKRKIITDERDTFLDRNFNISVYRYKYGGTVRCEGIEVLCEEIYEKYRKIL